MNIKERLEGFKNYKRYYDEEYSFREMIKIRDCVSTKYLVTFRDNPEQQNLYARVVKALSYLYNDRNLVRGKATIICKALPKLGLSHDEPNTHIAYSRGKVGRKNHKKRVCIKFSRFLARYCTGFTDAQIEKLQLGFQYKFDYTMKIVAGEDATAIYRNIPTLHSHNEIPGLTSCMTGGNADYVEDHFNLNPKNLKLVLLYSVNQLVARGKLWNNNDGTWFLDRVYIRRNVQGLSEDAAIENIRSQFEHKDKLVDYYKVTIELPIGSQMPYLDNADHFDRIGNKIKLYSGGDFEASTTDGTDPSKCCSCDECGDSCEETREIDGQDLCESCADDFMENHTEIDGEWYRNDDVCYDEVDECSILSDDAVCLHDCRYTHRDNATELSRLYYGNDEYALDDDVVETHNLESILEDDSKEVNGLIYHESEEVEETEEVESGVLNV